MKKINHWFLIRNKDRVYKFGDPLGLRLDAYRKITELPTFADFSFEELFQKHNQPATSNFCGLCCICLALYVFSGYCSLIPLINDQRLERFVEQLWAFNLLLLLMNLTNCQNLLLEYRKKQSEKLAIHCWQYQSQKHFHQQSFEIKLHIDHQLSSLVYREKLEKNRWFALNSQSCFSLEVIVGVFVPCSWKTGSFCPDFCYMSLLD